MKRSARLPPNEPNIYRYTHKGATSWLVQVKRAGRPFVAFFADGDEGAWASHRQAKTWLRELKPRIMPWNKLHRRSSLNRTGIIGVSVYLDRTKTGTRVRRWVAFWPTADGNRQHRSFSAAKFGERRARHLAVEARKKGVAEMLQARSAR